MFHLTQVPFVPRLHSRAILRAKIKDMAVSSLELVKLVNGTRISIGKVSNGKTGLPFQTFRCSRKFSTGTIRKVVYHLLSNRNFRNLLVNEKCVLSLYTGTYRKSLATCQPVSSFFLDSLSGSTFLSFSICLFLRNAR